MTKFIDIKSEYHKQDTDYNIHEYVDYVKGVLNGSIVANEYIKLACKRTLDFDERDDMWFDVEDVDKRIKLIWKLRHTTGHHHGKHFRLLPWQSWIISQLFGWKWKHNNLRVTHNAFIMISRKNGKTALSSAISLAALVVDNEFDQEIDIVANNSKQAGIAFSHCCNFVESIDPSQTLFKKYRGEIRVPALKSKIQVLSSDSMGLDGYSSSVVIFDEMHAQRDWSLYNVMKSSQGARQQPLMITLTTAGFLVGDCYPCYSMWSNCIDILRGEKKDDTQFSAIYQLDVDDDWKDESVWTKCSPSLDATVFRSFMRDEVTSAMNNSSLEVGVRTKTFNIWCQSSDTWLSHELLKSNMTPLDLEYFKQFTSDYCYIGVDLAAVSDITAVTLMVHSSIDDKFYFKTFLFLPEDTITTHVNANLYKEWRRNGYIIVTDGNVQDYDYIISKIMEIDKVIPIKGIYYDSWNATYFAVNCTKMSLPMYPFSQALGNFNRPTKEFERLLKMGRVVMDYNPAVLWCFGNSMLKFDFNENCKPVKSDARSGKIDAVIAMMQALGGYYLDQSPDADLTVL